MSNQVQVAKCGYFSFNAKRTVNFFKNIFSGKGNKARLIEAMCLLYFQRAEYLKSQGKFISSMGKYIFSIKNTSSFELQRKYLESYFVSQNLATSVPSTDVEQNKIAQKALDLLSKASKILLDCKEKYENAMSAANEAYGIFYGNNDWVNAAEAGLWSLVLLSRVQLKIAQERLIACAEGIEYIIKKNIIGQTEINSLTMKQRADIAHLLFISGVSYSLAAFLADVRESRSKILIKAKKAHSDSVGFYKELGTLAGIIAQQHELLMEKLPNELGEETGASLTVLSQYLELLQRLYPELFEKIKIGFETPPIKNTIDEEGDGLKNSFEDAYC